MEKKTFANKDMVGTPRGYVKKKDVERVDREMKPILETATGLLSLTPVGGAFRRGKAVAEGGAKLLQKPTQKLLSGPGKGKEITKEAFVKAITVPKEGRKLERMYRAEKATAALGKSKAPSRGGYSVTGAKAKSASEATTKRVAATNKTGAAAVKVLNKGTKPSGPKTRKADSGNFTSRVDATRKRERTPREKEQFGPLAKRRTTEVTPYKRPGGPVKKFERPGGSVTKYERPGGAVTKFGGRGGALTRSPGKADDARIVGLSTKGKMVVGGAAGAGLAAVGYKAAQQSNAGDKRDRERGADFPKGKGVPSMKREPSTEPSGKIPTPRTKPARPTTGGQSFKDKMQGRNWKGGASGGAPKSSAPVKKAGDKSRVASGYKGNWAGAGSARKPKTFQEAVRRNQTEEYTKARMRPKKNLLELFKKKR